MIIQSNLKYGEADKPWKPNLLTAILQLLFFPIVLVLMYIIMALIVLLDLLACGSIHCIFKATSKNVQMPDGSIKIINKPL